MNIFGQNYEEIGSKDKGLILRSSGKIKIQWGKKFIDLIDSDGNIISSNKTQNLIKSIDSSEEMNQDGFYYLEGSLIAKIGDQTITISSSEESDEELSSEEKEKAQKNIGLIFETNSDDNIYPKNGLVYILNEQKLYQSIDGKLSDIKFSEEKEESSVYNSQKSYKFYIGDKNVFTIDSDGIEGRNFSIKTDKDQSVLTVDRINTNDTELFDQLLLDHINNELTINISTINSNSQSNIYNITINSNLVWNIYNPVDYISIITKGIGNQTIELECLQNNTEQQRNCELIIYDIFFERLKELYPDWEDDPNSIVLKHFKIINFIQQG